MVRPQGMIFLSLIMPMLLIGCAVPRDSLKLAVSPTSIQAGENVTVRWHIPGNETAFINRIGQVKADGQAQIKLLETTTIYMAMDRKAGFELVSANVLVSGGRGNFNFDESQYKNPITIRTKTTNVSRLIERIYTILQDEMRFSIRELQATDSKIVLVTSQEDQAHLVQSSEPQIGGRRVAYLIELRNSQADGGFALTMSTLVIYKRKIESTWRQEDANSPVYRHAIDSVRDRIVRE